MVKELISPSRQWDTSKVLYTFQPTNANDILSMHLPVRPAKDHWCWLPASSGKFSSHSFYLYANHHIFSTASNIPKKIWLSIWNANILPRHKLLWWQILSDCLPTRTRLYRCLPDIDTCYPLCGHDLESLLHLLLYCDIVKLIWFSLPWNIRSDSLSFSTPLELLKFLLLMENNLNCGNTLLFTSVLFDLVWKSRNEVIHGGCIPDPMGLIRNVINSFNEINCTLLRPISLPVSWNPPPQDWLKFSMDATVGDSFSCAIVVVHDHSSSLLYWTSIKVMFTDPVFVEAQAVLLAISSAISMFDGCYCWFESDAKTVVESVLKPSETIYWPISTIASNYNHLLDQLSTWHISHSIRSGNLYAHNVARWCIRNDIFACFFGCFLAFLYSF
ncbi:hypothetical protein UlMin_029136 [Ulmus minor]